MKFGAKVLRGIGRALAFIALGIAAILPDTIGLCGLAALAWGCGLYSRPLAFIVPGAIIVLGRAYRVWSISAPRRRSVTVERQ